MSSIIEIVTDLGDLQTAHNMIDESICPWCGAGDPRKCDLEEEMGVCPWEETKEIKQAKEVPDPRSIKLACVLASGQKQ